jgi:hypothetical protein
MNKTSLFLRKENYEKKALEPDKSIIEYDKNL